MPAKEQRKVKQFNVYLTTDMVRRVKHHAVDTEQSLSAVVEKALGEYFARNARAKPAKE